MLQIFDFQDMPDLLLKGNLLISGKGLTSDLENRQEARQILYGTEEDVETFVNTDLEHSCY